MTISVPKRQLPARLAGHRAGSQQFLDQVVVVAHEPRRLVAEGDHYGTGERCYVHNARRLESACVRKRVAQYQSTFGIRVDNLDRLAEVCLDDIAGLHGGGGQKILSRGNQAHHVDQRFQPTEHLERAEYRCRPRHVELHLLHVERRLDGNAAGIERHSLPDQAHGLRGGSSPVLHGDKPWLLGRSLRDCQQGIHAFLLYLPPAFDHHLEAVPLTQRLGFPRQVARRAVVSGPHLQVACKRLAGGHRSSHLSPSVGGGPQGLRRQDLHVGEIGLRATLRAKLLERPPSLPHSLDYHSAGLFRVHFRRGFGSEEER